MLRRWGRNWCRPHNPEMALGRSSLLPTRVPRSNLASPFPHRRRRPLPAACIPRIAPRNSADGGLLRPQHPADASPPFAASRRVVRSGIPVVHQGQSSAVRAAIAVVICHRLCALGACRSMDFFGSGFPGTEALPAGEGQVSSRRPADHRGCSRPSASDPPAARALHSWPLWRLGWPSPERALFLSRSAGRMG